MAKIDENKYKRALLQRTEGYAANVRTIYLDVMGQLISLALEIEPIHDVKKPFVFADYPTISDKANGSVTGTVHPCVSTNTVWYHKRVGAS